MCRKMFRPDPRAGDRQRACSEKRCQRQRRCVTQSNWRSRNPSYPLAYRLERRAAMAAAAEQEPAVPAEQRSHDRKPAAAPPAPLRVPADLARFPWDLARDRLGFGGADLLAILATFLVRLAREAKDERLAESALSMQVYGSTGRDP